MPDQPKRTVDQPGARERLLAAALDLFARHGLEVGVRDIAKAADLKNVSAVRYYFGSKDKLIKAVIINGAGLAENWRRDQLRALLNRGTPALRDVLRIMVGPGGEVGVSHQYIRLLATVMLSEPALSPRKLAPEVTAAGYDACWQQVLRVVDDVPRRTLQHRFEYITVFILNMVATRAIQAEKANRKTLWRSRRDLEAFIDALEAIVTQPPA